MKRKVLALWMAFVLVFTAFTIPTVAFESTASTDVDFDGILDSEDDDTTTRTGNIFTGTYTKDNFTINIQYKMDYRNFFGDNTEYNADIAAFSVWAANFTSPGSTTGAAYAPDYNLKDSNGNYITTITEIGTWLEAHGMEDIVDYDLGVGTTYGSIVMPAYNDDSLSEVVFGHHKVTYNGETKDVVAVFVRTSRSTVEEWTSNFDLGDLNRYRMEYDSVATKNQTNHPNTNDPYLFNNTLQWKNEDWGRGSNHRGFDVVANRILKVLRPYVEAYVDSDSTPVFWLTGHSRGAAIANVAASYLVDEGNKVYAYTYATPGTTANTEASAERYDCIFNLVNTDDMVPKLPMKEWGFTRYGRTAYLTAPVANETNRSTILGTGDYSVADSQYVDNMIAAFVSMTVNNDGVQEGWRDVYVYHCASAGDDNGKYHTHVEDGETVGEYRGNLSNDTDATWRAVANNYNGGAVHYESWDAHVKKFTNFVHHRWPGWISTTNRYAICETPATAMMILGVSMGNLDNLISTGVNFLINYELADRFDFDKWNVVNAAMGGVTDPHAMENYYLIQTLLIRDNADPDSEFRTTRTNDIYSDSTGRPVHTHTYHYEDSQGNIVTCCTNPADGLGLFKVCNCSAENSSWYDDVLRVEPAADHEWSEPTYVWSSDNATCTAERHCLTEGCPEVETETVNSAYVENPAATVYAAGTGIFTATFTNAAFEQQVKNIELPQHQGIKITVLDEIDTGAPTIYVWNSTTGDSEAPWPGTPMVDTGEQQYVIDDQGNVTGPFEVYEYIVDADLYDKFIVNNGEDGNDNLQSDDTDLPTDDTIYTADEGGSGEPEIVLDPQDQAWTLDDSKTVDPTCTEEGSQTYVGSVTGEEKVVATPALGHDWCDPSEATFVWSADNSTCTATLVCTRDASHTTSETKTSTSVVTQEATLTTTGIRTYTVEFSSEFGGTQTTTEVIPLHQGIKITVLDEIDTGAPTIYVWNSTTGDSEAPWPGTPMVDTGEQQYAIDDQGNVTGPFEVYEYIVDADLYDKFIVNNGEDGNDNLQSDDTDLPTDDTIYTADEGGSGEPEIVLDPQDQAWTLDDSKTVDPTCTEEGSQTYVGSVTGEEKVVAIPALGHDWVAVTTVQPTYYSDGYTTYECSRCHITENRDIVEHLKVKVKGYSITAEGDIRLNAYILIPADLAENNDDLVVNLYEGETLVKTLPVSEAELTANGYLFPYMKPAKEMHTEVTLRLVDGEINIPLHNFSGTEITVSYSIQMYLNTIINNASVFGEKLVALAEAMSDYGSCAQAVKNYDLDNMETIRHPEWLAAVDPAALENNVTITPSADPTKLSFRSLSLVMDNKMAMRLYFNYTGEGTLKRGDVALTKVENRDVYYLDIEGIAAKNFGVGRTIAVTDGTLTVKVTNASVHAYCKTVLENANASDAAKNVCRAIVVFGEKALEYVQSLQH